MWRQRLEWGLIVGTGLLAVAAAALVGGVLPAHQVGLAAAALLTLGLAVAWRVYKHGSLAPGAPFWVLAGLAALTALQLVPLSPDLHALLQPRGAALIDYTTGGLGGPSYRCLSLDPPATALALGRGLGLAALAGAAALLARDPSRGLLLLWTLAFGGLALGLIALVQMVTGAREVFWIYAPEVGGNYLTPFVNLNHAGAFYALIGFLCLGLGLQLRERRPRLVVMTASALPFGLVVASASRGAIAASVLGAFVLLLLLRRARRLSGRQLGYGLAIAVILGTVALPASSTIREEFGRKTRWERIDEEAKLKAWADAVALARHYPVTGVGRGAFQAIFPGYQVETQGGRRTFSHPENVVVQLAVEYGPASLALLLALVGWLAVRYIKRVRLTPLHVAAITPISVLVLQNLVDFNLEFPGTAYPLAVLLGVLAGMRLGRTRRVASRRRRAGGASAYGLWLAAGATTLAIAGPWSVSHDLRTEGERVRRELEAQAPPEDILSEARKAIRRHPADYYLQYLAGEAALRIPGAFPLRYFNRSLLLNPRSTLTQYQVGQALQQLGLYRQAQPHYLQALRLGMPLTGSFARDLFTLLQARWQEETPARTQREAARCLGALAQVGCFAPAVCQVAATTERVRQAVTFRSVAQVDPAAAMTLARWLARSGLEEQALAAYAELADLPDDAAMALEPLVSLSRRQGDPGGALHWAERFVAATRKPEAYAALADILQGARQAQRAEKVVDSALDRYPKHVSLVATKAKLLIARNDLASARELLASRSVGRHLPLDDEMLLLHLRVKVEEKLGNRLRAERLRSRLGQLQRLKRSGFRGYSVVRD